VVHKKVPFFNLHYFYFCIILFRLMWGGPDAAAAVVYLHDMTANIVTREAKKIMQTRSSQKLKTYR